MFLLMGINPTQKNLEYNSNLKIHSCGAYERANVFLRANVLSFFFIETFKFSKKYYVHYTCCNRLFLLDPEVGRKIERGIPTEIKEEDLIEEIPTEYRCPNCNRILDRSYEYCPYCGNKVK